MRIAIVGAGAIGGLLGARLMQAGHTIGYVAHGETLAALRSTGIVVTSADGTLATGPVDASADPGELGARDLVIVAVKAWQVAEVALGLRPLVAAGTIVLPVQNGVEAADQLAATLGATPVIGGLCHVLATREGPARVRTQGAAMTLTIGELGGGTSERVNRLAAALHEAGVAATPSADIRAALWSKLLFVEPLGSVGAVTRAPAGVLRSVPETRALLEQAMREVEAVAAGMGVRLPEGEIARALARVDGLPADGTAFHASRHRRRTALGAERADRGRRRLGRRASVPRPAHDFLWASLLPQDRRLRSAAARVP